MWARRIEQCGGRDAEMGDGATSACRGEAKVAGRVVFFTKALQPVRLTRLLGVTTRQYTCFPMLCGCNCGEQGLVKVTALMRPRRRQRLRSLTPSSASHAFLPHPLRQTHRADGLYHSRHYDEKKKDHSTSGGGAIACRPLLLNCTRRVTLDEAT